MKKEAFVVFHIQEGENNYEAKVYTKDLRKILEEAKIKKDVESVELSLKYGDKTSKITMSIPDIRKFIKQSEIVL